MILIAFSSNLPSRYGLPPETFAHVEYLLEDTGVRLLKRSRIWMTAPVPVSDQPWYHNMVLQVETSHGPARLLQILLDIEEKIGRVRSFRDAPRCIDLDIVDYNGLVLNKGNLLLPHPRMHERAFVLDPLLDIAPDWQHPVLKLSAEVLRSRLSDEGQDTYPLDNKQDIEQEKRA